MTSTDTVRLDFTGFTQEQLDELSDAAYRGADRLLWRCDDLMHEMTGAHNIDRGPNDDLSRSQVVLLAGDYELARLAAAEQLELVREIRAENRRRDDLAAAGIPA